MHILLKVLSAEGSAQMFKKNTNRNGGLPFKIDHTAPLAAEHLAEQLVSVINEMSNSTRQLIIVCIGTDRSTGDALGPLVGSKLSAVLNDDQAVVYGTLDSPVHAVNLKDTIQEIETKYVNPFVIAIDACLGQLSSVGLVTLGNGPLKPGAGVNKVLPEVGNIHLTGIVNVGGFMEYFVLQNTRLSVVMRMADCIAAGLAQALTTTSPATYRRPAMQEGILSVDPLGERNNSLRINISPYL